MGYPYGGGGGGGGHRDGGYCGGGGRGRGGGGGRFSGRGPPASRKALNGTMTVTTNFFQMDLRNRTLNGIAIMSKLLPCGVYITRLLDGECIEDGDGRRKFDVAPMDHKGMFRNQSTVDEDEISSFSTSVSRRILTTCQNDLAEQKRYFVYT